MENLIIRDDPFLIKDESYQTDELLLSDVNTEVIIINDRIPSETFDQLNSEDYLRNNVVEPEVRVEEIPGLVQYVPSQDTYHVKSGPAGKFKVYLKYEGLGSLSPSEETFLLRMQLREQIFPQPSQLWRLFFLNLTDSLRRSRQGNCKQSYEHIPVNTICPKHSLGHASAPLQPLPTSPDAEDYYEYIQKTSKGRMNAYLFKKINPTSTFSTVLETSIELWFPCWNKCGSSTFPEVLTDSRKFTKEAGRSIYLSIILENKRKVKVGKELKINIWSKVNTDVRITLNLLQYQEDICGRDLTKKVMRGPKGAAAVKKNTRNQAFLDSFKRRLPSLSAEDKMSILNMLDVDSRGPQQRPTSK